MNSETKGKSDPTAETGAWAEVIQKTGPQAEASKKATVEGLVEAETKAPADTSSKVEANYLDPSGTEPGSIPHTHDHGAGSSGESPGVRRTRTYRDGSGRSWSGQRGGEGQRGVLRQRRPGTGDGTGRVRTGRGDGTGGAGAGRGRPTGQGGSSGEASRAPSTGKLIEIACSQLPPRLMQRVGARLAINSGNLGAQHRPRILEGLKSILGPQSPGQLGMIFTRLMVSEFKNYVLAQSWSLMGLDYTSDLIDPEGGTALLDLHRAGKPAILVFSQVGPRFVMGPALSRLGIPAIIFGDIQKQDKN